MAKLLSFDFGTGGVRAGVYCTDNRAMVSSAEATYDTVFPHTGWAEQDSRKWLHSMVSAGRRAVSAAGTGRIDAICVATTASTVAFCTRDGKPVRPAILWMDCRASEEAAATAEVDHPVMAYCGGEDAVEWLVPKAMWTARHQPDVYAESDVICEALDFINFHLTGQWVGSRMNAACKWNYDSLNETFVPAIYDQLGIGDLADKLPQRIVPVGGVIGDAAGPLLAEMGIENTPVVAQGGIDAHIGILSANTVRPGGVLVIGGTSTVHLTQLADAGDVSGFWGPYPNALTDGDWLVEAGQVSSGSILSWLSNDIFGLDAGQHQALIADVAERPGRANGLLALDYWMGNRTPYRDPDLRGAIMGLSLGHSRADIYAAAIDSIALGTANVLSVLGQRGVEIERFVMAGGICRNAAWLQATVDAIGRPVAVAMEENLSLVGAAVCSATALGMWPDLASVSADIGVATKDMQPNEERSRWYQDSLSLYQDATQVLTPLLHTLAKRQQTEAMS
ncbi:FGGY-family carbohydrate kinase [uncultured Hoeflea sp.]|uniref:FGGY-family carbohydrate kinase n=1 Tax=uncultured Hoeflea sp. TaxID=538666 RepID=UPI0030DAAB0D